MHWMFLPLRRYAEFSGRSRRREYWLYFLGVILFYILMMAALFLVVGSQILLSGDENAIASAVAGAVPMLLLLTIAWLGLLIPNLAVGARRLHDIDRSGWWLLVGYGPWLVSLFASVAGAPVVGAIFNFLSFIGFIACWSWHVSTEPEARTASGRSEKRIERGGFA